MIKDIIKLNGMNGIKVPQIKGHVKIRLYNPNTWKQEIIEGDNMITNALRDIFASNLCGAMKYNDMLPLYSKMLGGVICFGETLDISSQGAADDYFIPDNHANTVIAHAGQTPLTSQADDITRGSPSDTRMAVADGAVTLAWEWASTAGNGLIKSLGLTHTDVGDAGTGSDSDAFQAITPNINANLGFVPSQNVAFIDENGYGYAFSVSGTTMTISRFPMPYKKVGLISMNYDYTSGTFVSGVPSTKTLTLSISMGAQPYFAFDKSSNLLYLFYNTSTTDSVDVHIIDISTWDNPSMTITHPSWSLQSSVGPLQIWGNAQQPFPLPICNGYVYLPKNNPYLASEFLRIQLSSTGNQTRITGATAAGSTGVFSPNANNRVIAGKDFVINDGAFYKTGVGTPDVIMVGHTSNTLQTTILDQGIGLVQMARMKIVGTNYYYPSISKFYLASKFNLPTPVQKTNTQNMVVTYTLTEVSS